MAAPLLKGPILKGVVVFGSGDTEKDVTLSRTVTKGKSWLTLSGFINSSNPAQSSITWRILDNDTIRLNRNTAAAGTNSYAWELKEYSEGVTVEHLYVTPDDGDFPQAIAPVDTGKSFPQINVLNTGSILNADDLWSAEITTSTNCQLKANNFNSAVRIALQIVTIDDSTVTKYTGTTDTDGSTPVALSPSIVLAEAFWVLSYTSNSATVNAEDLIVAYSDAVDNINLVRAKSSSSLEFIYVLYTVNVNNNLTVQQKSFDIVTATLSDTVALTEVVEANTSLLSNGTYSTWGVSDLSSDDAGVAQAKFILTSNILATITRQKTDTAFLKGHFQALEWVAAASGGLVDREYPRGVNRGITRGVA